ncbi:MAG: GTP pyrophosphokinase [Acidobacteriota bacterium]|nr:GTP pyrophosphokinase [Acidobacteriota bacterium]
MADKLIDAATFFKKYNVQEDALEKTGLEWASLEAVHVNHTNDIPNLQPIANYIAESLRQVKEVHSLRIRIKDPEHLVEKIIRKKLDDPALVITPHNYKEHITDLIGVRALHLFKEDWNRIHDFVDATWNLHETPTANVRQGDSEEYTRQYTEKGCKINVHKYGYRSVHYIIKSQPSKEVFIAELQVRTIFEEGWSEIDHNIRYPYDLGNVILAQVSAIHNRLAGSADEISSFIKILKKELGDRDAQYEQALKEHDKIVAGLNAEIQKLRITEKQKEDLEKRLNSLSSKVLYEAIVPDFSKALKALAEIKIPTFDPALITAAAVAAQQQKAKSEQKPPSTTTKKALVEAKPSEPKREKESRDKGNSSSGDDTGQKK